jgi:hypothetical protein
VQGGELRGSGVAAEGLRRRFVAFALAAGVVVEIFGAPGPGARHRSQHQGCGGGCPHADTLRCHSAAHLSHQPLTMSLNECATPAASGPLHSHPFHLTTGESGPRAPPPPVKSRRRSFCERKLNEEKKCDDGVRLLMRAFVVFGCCWVHVYERLCAAGAHIP